MIIRRLNRPIAKTKATYDLQLWDALERFSYDVNLYSILQNKTGQVDSTNRITTSPYNILVTDYILFFNTDGGNITANLPAGIEGTRYKIINSGTSGNTLTVTPNGTEQLFGGGAGVSSNLSDGQSIDIHYNSVDGWY